MVNLRTRSGTRVGVLDPQKEFAVAGDIDIEGQRAPAGVEGSVRVGGDGSRGSSLEGGLLGGETREVGGTGAPVADRVIAGHRDCGGVARDRERGDLGIGGSGGGCFKIKRLSAAGFLDLEVAASDHLTGKLGVDGGEIRAIV